MKFNYLHFITSLRTVGTLRTVAVGTLHATCLLLFFVMFFSGCTSEKPVEETTIIYDMVIAGGRVMDPETGLNEIANVAINGSKIAKISIDSLSGKKIIDAKGLIVSPGFIDLHEHGASDDVYQAMVRDGVTTAFELEVGTANVNHWYDERKEGQVVNYGVSIGHIKARMEVFDDPGSFTPMATAKTAKASPEQINEMEKLLEKGLEEGAVAVGFGLAYTPGATTDEFKTMLRVAKKYGATSHIHLRGGLEGLHEAINSAVEVGTPLHIVHINSASGPEISEFLKVIEEAQAAGHDISTEAYPYEAGMTTIESAMFDPWESWSDERIGIYQWVETGEFLTRETFGEYRKKGGAIFLHARTEEMTLKAIESPLTMIASDGFLINGKGHPRTTGSYSKVLGKYVRELKALSLEDAIAKMTIRPAQRLEARVASMKTKGRLQEGMDADITLFNPETVIDQSTYAEPLLFPKGILYVVVGGTLVVEKGELVEGAKPGKGVRARAK